MKPEFSRSAMTPEERALRARIAQIAQGAGVIRGTLVERMQVCGKPTCRCTRGHKHRALVLTIRSQGRAEQIYVPHHLEATVRRWVEQDRELRDLLGELDLLHAEKVKELKSKGAQSSDGS